jgi:hypothetical protein
VKSGRKWRNMDNKNWFETGVPGKRIEVLEELRVAEELKKEKKSETAENQVARDNEESGGEISDKKKIK